jgi:hypothetical protein
MVAPCVFYSTQRTNGALSTQGAHAATALSQAREGA